MTSIQRPGGPADISGPSDLSGPEGPDGPDHSSSVEAPAAPLASATAAGPDRIANLATAVDAGTLPAQQAIEQLLEDSVAGLPPSEATELRAMMADMLANDPYLTGLAQDLGVPRDPSAVE